MNRIADIIITAVIVAILVAAYFTFFHKPETNKADQIKENVDKTVNYDSIISVTERKLLDSIAGIREELQHYKDEQHRENVLLHKQNDELIRKFKSLDTSDRPDF